MPARVYFSFDKNFVKFSSFAQSCGELMLNNKKKRGKPSGCFVAIGKAI